MTTYQAVETRVNPENKHITGPDLEAYKEKTTKELRDRVRPLILETLTADPTVEDPELEAALSARAVAATTLTRELTLRGIGWPNVDLAIHDKDADTVTVYSYVNDPSVPWGEAVQGEPKLIEQPAGGNHG